MRYELVIESALNCYILDTKTKKVVALCSTKRPNLEFSELQNLIDKANSMEELNCDD